MNVLKPGGRPGDEVRVELAEPQWLQGHVAFGGGTDGRYLGTWLRGRRSRVTAHGMGGGGEVTVAAGDQSLMVLRRSGRGWRVSDADVLGVGRRRGPLDRVLRRSGVAVISWRLGGADLDTVLRPRKDRYGPRVEESVQRVLRRSARA